MNQTMATREQWKHQMGRETEVLLHEYDAVYAEVRQSIALHYTVLGLGFAFLGIIAKETVAAYIEGHFLISGMLGLFLGLFDAFLVFAWLGELARMRRGSVYLSWVETCLRHHGNPGDRSMTRGFHTWLLSGQKNPQLKCHYVVTFGFLGMVGLSAAAYSIWLAVTKNFPWFYLCAAVAVEILVLAAMITVAILLLGINRWPIGTTEQICGSQRKSQPNAEQGTSLDDECAAPDAGD